MNKKIDLNEGPKAAGSCGRPTTDEIKQNSKTNHCLDQNKLYSSHLLHEDTIIEDTQCI